MPARSCSKVSLNSYSLAAKDPGQFRPSAVQARLYGSLWNLQSQRDFAVFHLFQIPEDDGLTELRRKLLQSALDQLAGLAPRHHTFRASRESRALFENRQMILQRSRSAIRLGSAVMVNQEVA